VEAAEAIRRYFNGVNNEDWDDFRGIWHDDAVIEVVGGIRVQGWDEILPYYTGALAGFPVHYDDPYKVHTAGDTITVEIAFTGETVDGVPTTFEAVDVFTMEDGLVRRLTASCARPAPPSGGSARWSDAPRPARTTGGRSTSCRSRPTPSRTTSRSSPSRDSRASPQTSSSRSPRGSSRTSSSAATARGR
jgi:ketosteroid isomerase-like protein